MPRRQHYALLLNARSCLTASFIPTIGEATTHWMRWTSNTSGSIILNSLQTMKNHINGIENFWNQAKRHMRKFNGVPKEHFGLFLKECEWRFNNSNPQSQLRQLRQWVKGNLGQLSGTATNIIQE